MWPPEALEFLRDLEANNDRDWFKANRKRYDAYLLEPARALSETLADLGEPHFFRPYNDMRFHQRPPIKEQLGVALGYGPAGGFYFELSLDGLFVAAGLHRPASDQIDRFRRAIDDGRVASGFETALGVARGERLELAEPELKRVPRGYAPDHARADLLRLKQFTVSRRHPLKRWLHTKDCQRKIRTELEAARPLVDWLGRNVGPSETAQLRAAKRV
jgi:uncharacterized protein (TIGR02453 family)